MNSVKMAHLYLTKGDNDVVKLILIPEIDSEFLLVNNYTAEALVWMQKHLNEAISYLDIKSLDYKAMIAKKIEKLRLKAEFLNDLQSKDNQFQRANT